MLPSTPIGNIVEVEACRFSYFIQCWSLSIITEAVMIENEFDGVIHQHVTSLSSSRPSSSESSWRNLHAPTQIPMEKAESRSEGR